MKKRYVFNKVFKHQEQLRKEKTALQNDFPFSRYILLKFLMRLLTNKARKRYIFSYIKGYVRDIPGFNVISTFEIFRYKEFIEIIGIHWYQKNKKHLL